MNENGRSRRRVLAGGLATVATAVAGCASPVSEDSESGPQEPGRQLRLTLARKGDRLRETFIEDLDRSSPEWDEEAFAAVREGREYTTQYQKPFPSSAEGSTYAVQDGTYYQLGSVVVGERETTRPVLRLSTVEDATDAVAADRLPSADQVAVRVAHMAARARGNEGGYPQGLVQRGGFVYRQEKAVRASELLADDGPTRVTYRDRTYTVEVTRERFYEPVYQATGTAVAEDPETMEAILRARFLDARLSSTALSMAAREVLEAARTDEHSEIHPYSTGYREVLRALDKRAFIDGNIRKDAGVETEGPQMVRYDGIYYDYRLRFE